MLGWGGSWRPALGRGCLSKLEPAARREHSTGKGRRKDGLALGGLGLERALDLLGDGWKRRLEGSRCVMLVCQA